MIKKLLVTFTCLILLFSLVIAQESSTNSSNSTKSSLKIPTEKTDNLLEKEVDLPTPVKKIVGIVLGFKESEKITWSIMVGIISFLIAIFVIFVWTFELMPFFNEIGSILGALMVTILIGTTGGVKEIVEFYFKSTDSIKILESWSTGATIFFTIIIIFLIIISRKITKSLKKLKENERVEIDGTNIGWNLATLNKLKDELFRKGD